MGKSGWKNILELDSDRKKVAGSAEALIDAIGRAADLRIYTTFLHNEHIDTSSHNSELVKEVSAFQVTYLVDQRWAAGIMMLRQPVDLPDGFGPRPSLSLFMYNQDGSQAIARPFLDGKPVPGTRGPYPVDGRSDMPKYHQFDNWDKDTNAPSHNFIYDFGSYKFFVRDVWREVLSIDEHGRIRSGSFDDLISAFNAGSEIKIGLSGLCSELAEIPDKALSHLLFIQTGWNYYYTDRNLFISESLPFVRVGPAIPMRYRSNNWDFGWAIVKTDGTVELLLYDPYTLQPQTITKHLAVRYFVL